MALMRWNPVRNLAAMEEAERLFNWPFARPIPWDLSLDGGLGELDMYETDDAVMAKAFLPGIKPEDVKVSLMGNTLRIEGESKQEREVKDEQFLRREHRYGKFLRSVQLPDYAQADKAEATYENGTLTIRVPKTEPSKAKTIKVTIAQK